MKSWISVLALGVAATAGSACKWSEFDDIKDDAVVSATDKPDNGATIWGIGLVPAQRSTSEAGLLGVFGASEPTYNEVVYSASGSSSIGERTVKFEDFGYASINVDPIVLASPDSDDVALVGVPASEGVVFRGKNAGLEPVKLTDSMTPDAATYIRTGATSQDDPILIVADDDKLYGVSSTTTATRCSLPLGIVGVDGTPRVRALGAMRATGSADKLVVWLDDGNIVVLGNDILDATQAGCPGGVLATVPTVVATTEFVPTLASQILNIRTGTGNTGSQDLVFYGRSDSETVLQSFHVTGDGTLAAVGEAVSVGRSSSATVLHTDSDLFVAVGFPNATVESVPAGQVQLFPVDVTSGVAGSLLTLYDAQPEEDQQYGRSVAAIPYNGKEVLAVAGDNEVYLYFRTELYDETRVKGQ